MLIVYTLSYFSSVLVYLILSFAFTLNCYRTCAFRIKSLVHRTQCRRLESSLLSGLFLIMSCFRLIQQSVLLSLSVRSESLMQKVPDPRSYVYECLQGLESVLAGTDRPTLA